MAYKNALGSTATGSGARAQGPSLCPPPGSGVPRSPAPMPGASYGAGKTNGNAASAGGKVPGVLASRASDPARCARGGARAWPARRGGAGGRSGLWHRKRWEARAVPGCPARRGLGPLPPSRWREGEREREARPLAGRASVGQCVRARGAVSARHRAQPPPLNGHVGAQRRRRLLFLILRTGLRRGPPPLRLCPCLGRLSRRLVASLQPLPAGPPASPLVAYLRPSAPAGSPAPLRRGARSM